MTVILGIDPGSRCTGFGVLDLTGGRPRYLASGVVRPRASDLAERLGEILGAAQQLIDRYHPAVEDVFVARDPRAALRLGQARGVVIAVAAQRGVAVVEYSARAVKQAVVGSGGATKEQVQHMVVQILGLPAVPPADAADALGVAICHAHGAAAGFRRGRR